MKIALVGSAPSSMHLAPYDDLSWEIWGCSVGTVNAARRITAWFEAHDFNSADPLSTGFLPDYIEFMARQPCVFMIKPSPLIPKSVAYPREAILKEFGPYFFTSTVAWMLALAISKAPDEISLYGIDMAAKDEYGYQRAGCHHFIELAKARGIKITVPAQSDLLRPPPIYGMQDPSPVAVKFLTRKNELQNRLNAAQAQHDATFREMMFLRGAIDDLDYFENIICDQDTKSILGG